MLRRIIILLMTLISATAQADSFELLFGGITDHYTASPYGVHPEHVGRYFWNDQVILNLTAGVRYTRERASVAVFGGQNSVGLPMAGALAGYGFTPVSWLYAGAVAGGYVQNSKAYRATGGHPEQLFETPSGLAFVPLAGVEIDFRAPVTDHIFLKQDNLLAPIITNHGVSIGFVY